MNTNTASPLTPASLSLVRAEEGVPMESYLETFCAQYVDELSVAKQNRGIIRLYFGPLRQHTLASITPLMVEAWFHDIGKHSHAQANKCLSVLRMMYVKAHDWRLFMGENPAQRIKKYKKVERERFVTPEEMPRLQAALMREDEAIQCFFLLCLLVGCRKGEAMSLQWTDLDGDRKVWRKPMTKTRRSHLVPVPLALLERLLALPRRNAYVFSSRNSHWNKTFVFDRWQEIRTAAGLPDVTVHDLRRTCASWLSIHGENMAVVCKGVLNHVTLANGHIYTRLNVSPVAMALEANSVRMMAHASVTEPAPAVLQCTTSDPTAPPRPQPLASPRAGEEERDEWPG